MRQGWTDEQIEQLTDAQNDENRKALEDEAVRLKMQATLAPKPIEGPKAAASASA